MTLGGFSNLYLSVIPSPHGCPGSCHGLISAHLALLLLTSVSREKLDSGSAFSSISSDSLFICFLGFTFLIQLSPALQLFFPQLLTPGCRAGSIHLWLSWQSTGRPPQPLSPCHQPPLVPSWSPWQEGPSPELSALSPSRVAPAGVWEQAAPLSLPRDAGGHFPFPVPHCCSVDSLYRDTRQERCLPLPESKLESSSSFLPCFSSSCAIPAHGLGWRPPRRGWP